MGSGYTFGRAHMEVVLIRNNTSLCVQSDLTITVLIALPTLLLNAFS